MQFEINLVFCVLVVVLTGSSQTRGHGSALLPVTTLTAIPSLAVSSASPHLTEDAGTDDLHWTHNPTARGETTTMNTTVVHSETATKAIFTSSSSTASSAVATSQHLNVPFLITARTATPSPSAAADSLSSSSPTAHSSPPPPHIDTTTEARGALLTTDPPATSSSQLAHSLQDTNSTATATASTIQPQSESLTPAATTQQPTTARLPLTSTAGRGPVGPTHKEVPSELNVGDEDIKRPRSRSPLDPLLAGLLSVFIVTTAFVFVVLFLKFRQRTNHPEFHRLQDLPMDDLMEDTPLSRYSY